MAMDHKIFNRLLVSCVDHKGWVDYRCFQNNSDDFREYLEKLKKNPPDKKIWSREEQLAYWINAYNAFTIDLILQHYPVASIKDIKKGLEIPFVNSVWDQRNLMIGGKKFSLNDIEHSILRSEFSDSRIHFSINCASVSCPALMNSAFDPDSLDQQLEKQARRFLNDTSKNFISRKSARISRIFLWFGYDFGGTEGVRKTIKKYYFGEVSKDLEIDYKDYDWRLNEVPRP
jgi:Protein of unknown function, DUF547